MYTYRKRILFVAIGILVSLSLLTGAGNAEQKTQQQTEQGLHEFWTMTLQGEEVTQEIFAPYTLTMINVWATYCPPCLHEMPALAELQKEYKDKGVNIIGIVSDINDFSNQEAVTQGLMTANYIIHETGAHYMHLLPSEDLYNLRLKNLQVVPETFFVDSRGTIVGETIQGARDKSAWTSIIEDTLKLVE